MKNEGLEKSWFLLYSAFRIKNILTNSIFLLFLEIEKEIFLPITGFSRTTTQIQGLSSAWNFSPILGLSRIFKDRGNPANNTKKKTIGISVLR